MTEGTKLAEKGVSTTYSAASDYVIAIVGGLVRRVGLAKLFSIDSGKYARSNGTTLIGETTAELIENTGASTSVPTLAALKALTTRPALVTNYSREAPTPPEAGVGGGSWIFITGDQSALVGSDPQSGIYAAPDSDPTGENGVWQRIVSPGNVHVSWWGAKGRGISNDRAAINSAVAHAKTLPNGGTVFFRSGGQYLISGGYVEVFGASSVLLASDGSAKAWIINGNTDIPAIRFGDNVSYNYNNGICNLAFSSASGVVGVSGQCGLAVYKQGQGRWSDLLFTSYPAALYDGLVMEGSAEHWMDRNVAVNCLRHGMTFNDVSDIHGHAARSHTNGGSGFVWTSSEGVYCTGWHAFGNGDHGWEIVGADNRHWFPVNCLGDSSVNDNWLITSLQTGFFTNCWGSSQGASVANAGARGFLLMSEEVTDVVFVNGGAVDNNGDGVTIYDDGVGGGSPTNIEFIGFAFGRVGNGNGKQGVGAGLTVNGSANVTVTNGQILDNATPVNNASTGIVRFDNVTGYKQPWNTDTPTVSAGSGTITSASATSRYRQTDLGVSVQISVAITTNGTGAVSVNVEVPFTAAETYFIDGRNLATGARLLGQIIGGTAVCNILNSDGSYPGADGAALFLSGMFESTT